MICAMKPVSTPVRTVRRVMGANVRVVLEVICWKVLTVLPMLNAIRIIHVLLVHKGMCLWMMGKVDNYVMSAKRKLHVFDVHLMILLSVLSAREDHT